jgi:hypothetical protein
VYLVKMDTSGNIQWNQTYGGTSFERGWSVVQTSDGGYAIAGSTVSFGAGGYDIYLVKTDPAGNMQWNQTYGGGGTDLGYSMAQSSDGGFVIAGVTGSFVSNPNFYDVYLVKTNASGAMQWNQTYGGARDDFGMSVVKTSDGGYAIAGYTDSFGSSNTNVYLVKVDANGNLQWNQTYGGTNNEEGRSIVQTTDGGYAIAGDSFIFMATSSDVYLVKVDANGNLQWNQTYGGANTDYGYSVIQTSEGGYAIAGTTASFGTGYYEAYLVKTDATGNMQWNQTYGGAGSVNGVSVVQTSEGGYALAGYASSFGSSSNDVYLVKTDVELGLSQTGQTANTLTLYRGVSDSYWNFLQVRIWKID